MARPTSSQHSIFGADVLSPPDRHRPTLRHADPPTVQIGTDDWGLLVKAVHRLGGDHEQMALICHDVTDWEPIADRSCS
jgi:hypothetical protein